MIAKTGNHLRHRWAVLAGEGDEAEVIGYATTRGFACYKAGLDERNRGPKRTCEECCGIGLVMLDYMSGDYCPQCDGDGQVSDLLPCAEREISRDELQRVIELAASRKRAALEAVTLAHELGLNP